MDDFLKNKLNDYDAGFDNSAWSAIEDRVRENNNGNESLKNNLKGFDAGYNQNAWENIASRVTHNNLTYKTNLFIKRIAGAAIVVGVLISSFVGYTFFTNSNTTHQLTQLKTEPNHEKTKTENPEPMKADNTIPNITNSRFKKAAVIKNKESKSEPKIKVQPKLALNAPTKIIAKPELPKLYLAKSEYCLGERLSAKILNNSEKNYRLKIANKWVVENAISSYHFNKSGKVKIELFELNSKNKLSKIENKTVVVYSKTNAIFSFHKEKLNDIPVTHFVSKGNNLNSTKWYIGNKLIGENNNTDYTFVNKGKYPVKLVTCSENGCKDSSTQTVRILKAYNLLATQIFNPENETWLPLGLKKPNKGFKIRIVTANGEKAFETSDSNKEWNGVIEESGKTAKNGDEFYWVAQVKGSNGQTHEYGGSFIVSSLLH